MTTVKLTAVSGPGHFMFRWLPASILDASLSGKTQGTNEY